MTRQQKLRKIKELEFTMAAAARRPANWQAYNEACDEIGVLNRSMLRRNR